MKLTRPVLINGALALVIVAALVGGLFLLNPWGSSASSSGGTQLTGTVQQGVVSRSISASGQIDAKRSVTASFAASGTVAGVKIALGDTVAKGQSLAVLDRTELQSSYSDALSELSRARSSLSAAQKALAKAKAGAQLDDGAGGTTTVVDSAAVAQAQTQVTNAKSQLSSAQKAATAAKSDLAGATLTAPIAGMVIEVNGSAGTAVSAGGSGGSATASGGFITIADISAYTITAAVAEADIVEVVVGQAAEVSFPALDDTAVPATVTAIAPTATSSNGVVTYATTITLDEVPAKLRLGQSAEAVITIESSAADALYVPTAAITTGTDGGSTVEVVGDDGSSTTVSVTTGVVGDQGTEILSGLSAGQTIVLGEYVESESSTSQTGRFSGFTGGFTGAPSGGFGGGPADFGGMR